MSFYQEILFTGTKDAAEISRPAVALLMLSTRLHVRKDKLTKAPTSPHLTLLEVEKRFFPNSKVCVWRVENMCECVCACASVCVCVWAGWWCIYVYTGHFHSYSYHQTTSDANRNVVAPPKDCTMLGTTEQRRSVAPCSSGQWFI